MYLFSKNLLWQIFLFLILMINYPSLKAESKKITQYDVKKQLAQLEKKTRGHIGVYTQDTGNKRCLAYRENERFPMMSTAKLLIVGAALSKSISEPSFLNQTLTYTLSDIKKSGYAPITGHHLSHSMTIKDLCCAAMQYSDNAAANLIMKRLGGPHKIQQFTRRIHDNSFLLNQYEPKLNDVTPGDKNNTSTPKAMANSLQELALSDILSLQNKRLLQQWLKGNTTGKHCIRSILPKEWQVGDKTGTGSYGATHDLAIIWPPKEKPIILAIYFIQSSKQAKPNEKIVASIARIVLNYLNNKDK
jgi:beta-lactamase class A